MRLNRTTAGGLFSFLAFVASAVFFGLLTFEQSLEDVRLLAAGLFSLALGFVLQRLSL